jgi:hypothetical protein
MESLAFVLRNKGCSSLRKTHLMFLARTWGYQSELWCRRDERRAHVAKMDRARAQAAQAHAAAVQQVNGGAPSAAAALAPAAAHKGAKRPPPSAHAGGGLQPRAHQKLALHAHTAVYPHAAGAAAAHPAPFLSGSVPSMMLPRAGAARSTAGGISAWAVDVRHGAPAPRAAAGTLAPIGGPVRLPDDEGAPLAAIAAHVTVTLRPLATESARLFGGSGHAEHAEVLAAAEWLRDIAADTAAALARLRARAAALPRDTARTVAWLHLLNQPCPLEDCMLRLQQGLHCAALEYTGGGRPGGPTGGMAPAPRWPEDMVQGALMGLELVARCQALATQSKFTAYGTYIKATIQLKALIADYTASVSNNLLIRSARLAAAAAAAAGGPLHTPSPPPLLNLELSDILGKEMDWRDIDGADADAMLSCLAPVDATTQRGAAQPAVALLPLPAALALPQQQPQQQQPLLRSTDGSGSPSASSGGGALEGLGCAVSTDGSDASGLWV